MAIGFATPSVRHTLLSKTSSSWDRATSGRASLVANGVRIAADHPFAGVGVGGFKRAYADRVGFKGKEPKRAASHNAAVTVAAEAGLPGLVLLLWLVGVAIFASARRAGSSWQGRAAAWTAADARGDRAAQPLLQRAARGRDLLGAARGLRALGALGERDEGRQHDERERVDQVRDLEDAAEEGQQEDRDADAGGAEPERAARAAAPRRAPPSPAARRAATSGKNGYAPLRSAITCRFSRIAERP